MIFYVPLTFYISTLYYVDIYMFLLSNKGWKKKFKKIKIKKKPKKKFGHVKFEIKHLLEIFEIKCFWIVIWEIKELFVIFRFIFVAHWVGVSLIINVPTAVYWRKYFNTLQQVWISWLFGSNTKNGYQCCRTLTDIHCSMAINAENRAKSA